MWFILITRLVAKVFSDTYHNIYLTPLLEAKHNKWGFPVNNSSQTTLDSMCREAWYLPAIQSTAMPSTRLMPVVMMSSLQVWSRLALEILFRPMSVQYTVSFPAKCKARLMTRENVMINVAAAKCSNKQAHETTFYCSMPHFTKCVPGL